jgi:hypothetical protein
MSVPRITAKSLAAQSFGMFPGSVLTGRFAKCGTAVFVGISQHAEIALKADNDAASNYWGNGSTAVRSFSGAVAVRPAPSLD